ncbi:hypothetical protein PINS_up012093, partial [Pythium insidiosum]
MATAAGSSQDELMLLEQLERRLGGDNDVIMSERSATTIPHPRRTVSSSSNSHPPTMASSPPPPKTATFTTPPRHPHRSTAAVAADAASSSAQKKMVPSAIVMTPPSVVVVESKQEFESPDFTDEAWEQIDQLVFEATQRKEDGALASQVAASPQVHASAIVSPHQPTTKPCLPAHEAHRQTGPEQFNLGGVITRPEAVQASPPVDKRLVFDDEDSFSSPAMPQGEPFQRLLVLEVERDFYQRRLILRLMREEDERQVEAILMEDWFDTPLEAGDTINLVLTHCDGQGFFFSQPLENATQATTVTVDNSHHLVVVHPDILVSPTSVTTSFGCLRRAVLRETLNVSRPTNEKALLGTMKHELFQHALIKGEVSSQFLHQQARHVVTSNVLQLFESGLSEDKALVELQKVVDDFATWLRDAPGRGILLNEPPGSSTSGHMVTIGSILAVEEMLWSIQWGLKGSTDVSVEAVFSNDPEKRTILPIELKTGSKMYGGVEHQGQVILYTLLLNERYQQSCHHGLLLYAPGIETNRVTAMAAHIRGLVMARNKFASAMARVKAMECD